ncbi:MAG: hypothetical protein OEM97_10010, partial [Acidimicrobiia bacterium]|nr:hypothetical protein [Acidimicrobiia bacterium]
FDFAGGPGPKFSVAVEVGPGVDGPWESADLSPGPSLDTSSFFVRFTVQNLDTLGYMTQLQVDSDVLGVDLCPNHVSEADQLEPDVPAGNPDAVVVCTVGPFQTEPGDQAIAFSTPENAGYRQGDNDCGFFEVPILAPPASPGEHVFTFYFEPADLCGLGPAVSGHAPGSPVDLGLGLLTATDVDCSDQFNGSGGGYSDDPAGSPNLGNGDPRVVAYSVTTFDGGGAVTGQCSNIPQFDDPFDAIDGPDDVFHYVGLTQP